MKKNYNEFVIGLSVTIAILIVIGSIMWLEKSNILTEGLSVNLVVQDAKGITVGDDVLFKGLAIGSVQKTAIKSEGIVLTLKMKGDVLIPSDSKFEIKEISLLGEKAVVIIPGKATTYLKSGQTVYGKPEESILDMAEHSKKLTSKINRILSHLDSLSGENNMEALTQSIHELRELLLRSNQLLQAGGPHLQGTLKDLHELTSKNKGAIDSLLQTFGSKSIRLKESLIHLNRISKRTDALLNRLEQGQGTMGKLLQNDSLYNNLNRTILHLDSLILSIKKNPKKFFEVKVF
ncbi:hypothetical protein DRI50_05340 [candidate division KSB1 bacterium]|nr:MAG: hypothetical protein DRI50_05340 [candidate division KSB1 bacterium]